MKRIIIIIYLLAATVSLNVLRAQVFTILPGTDVTIKKGTVVFADSLTLVPSADFGISNTSLIRSAITHHVLPDPYIARVYQFTNISKLYSGSVQVNYREGAELNGIPETELKLNIFNGTSWNSYPPADRNVANNYVNTAGLNCVRLNELTLSAECPPPTLQCNADIVVNAEKNRCGASVCYKPPVINNVCGTATVKQTAGLPSGGFFPVGVTTNTFVATNSAGKTAACSFTITVKDKQPPLITRVNTNPAYLWPPNHSMRFVTVNYNVGDNCGAAVASLEVSSNEPVCGTGRKDKTPDWIIIDEHHLQLRAERSKHRHERIYTITITAKDASGNTAMQKATVIVAPAKHDMRSKDNNDYVEDNEDYDGEWFECKVFPNPSAGYFEIQVQSESDEPIDVTISDINGRLVSKMNAGKDKLIRLGDELHTGVYMAEIRQGDRYKVVKLVKK